jgi:hypothetical protein
MAVRVVDYSALTAPLQPGEVQAFRAAARSSGAPWASVSLNNIVAVVFLGFFALIFFFVFGGVALSFVSAGLQNGNPIGIGLPLVILIAAVAVGVSVARTNLKGGGKWGRWMRLDRFARMNGMSFTPVQSAPSYPGEIFQLGRDRTALDHLTTSGGRFLDLGNYRWVTGSGKEQTTHNWGFLALNLDRRMPNIVLDSRANNTIFGSNLPAVLDKSQVLHLEGDFDRYFTLYCPKEYERDALYIFTPDLMALLIDEAAPYDVELVDDWMFVYSSKPFEMTSPAVLQRLFTIADTVGAKALSQTERYADERVGDFAANIVAPQGARLKRGVSVLGVVLIAAFVLIWGWSFFGQVFASVFGG